MCWLTQQAGCPFHIPQELLMQYWLRSQIQNLFFVLRSETTHSAIPTPTHGVLHTSVQV